MLKAMPLQGYMKRKIVNLIVFITKVTVAIGKIYHLPLATLDQTYISWKWWTIHNFKYLTKILT